MLKELYIKNVAVIDEARIEFGGGFNVLTGETGAGKSILIDSINMALGNRASHDLIRTGCDSASVTACFESSDKKILDKLDELGFDADGGEIIVTRRITSDGKSSCRVNGMPAPAASAREITSMLIDIHGQSDNQSLLCSKNHLGFLDSFAGLGRQVEDYRAEYSNLKKLDREIESLSGSEEEKKRRLDLLEYQINEIESAALTPGEDAELEERREYMQNAESIARGGGDAYDAIYGGEEYSAYDLLRRAEKELADIARFDKRLDDGYSRLGGLLAEVEDIASEISACLSGSDFSAAELDALEGRLDTINDLKRKYGAEIEDILDYLKKAKAEAESIVGSDERIAELREERAGLFEKVKALAENLGEKRRSAAAELEKKIMNELAELDMPKVKFAVMCTKCMKDGETELNSDGCDAVEFMISANPGEALKPMSKIASGGELSRIMLAVKSILADADSADTMIFDEIDTGVSGRAAQKIAEKISRLAAKKQILAITHLAQLAGMADSHYLIKKTATDSETRTSVKLLDTDERCDELARIIGGVTVTELTRQSAREMLELAQRTKESRK